MSDIATRTTAPVELLQLVHDETLAGQIAQALPHDLPMTRFASAAKSAAMQNSELAKAEQKSLFLALVKCARLGLLPDGHQAIINVYGGKATLIPMIAGVRDTVAKFGWTIKTAVVCQNDPVFEVDEANDTITHRRAPLGTDRGEMVGAYAVGKHRDGRGRVIEVMDRQQVMARREKAKTKNVWDGPFAHTMWEKTVAHRLAKKLPLDPRDAAIVHELVDAADLDDGDARAMLYGPNTGPSFGELPSGAHPYVNLPDSPDAPATDLTDTQAASPAPVTGEGDTADGDTQPSQVGDAAAVSGENPAPTDEEMMLSLEAADWTLDFGKYGPERDGEPLTLGGVYALGQEGTDYLAMCLRRLKDGPARVQLERFCRVAMPTVFFGTKRRSSDERGAA